MKTKKPYSKPKIGQVKLVPGEAVLTGCKTTSGVGGKADKCYPVSAGCKTTSGS